MSEEIRDCHYCIFAECFDENDKDVQCWCDIPERIYNFKSAETCPYFEFDDSFPKN